MSVYSVKGKGWRYDFTLNGTRQTAAWFKTKSAARKAEMERREEIQKPASEMQEPEMETKTDISFLDLVNRRLDYVKAYNSDRHYTDHLYLARKWVKTWSLLSCSQLSTEMVQSYLLKRKRQTSGYTANKELRYLRALFNFGMHPTRNWIDFNPTRGIEFFPVEKRIKYVPSKEDVLRVIMAADSEMQDYLWTIAMTMGRMSEINRLTWQDISFEERSLTLYTRKKRGGHLTPRKIPMTEKLHGILLRRYNNQNKQRQWVFWHRYWDRKKGEHVEGQFIERKRIMTTLCRKAGVRYFRFHALRHFGASLLDASNIPIGSIQRILGHESRTTTELYLHSIGEGERGAMRVFEDRFCEKSHTDSHTIEKEKTG
jgi:integrase